MLVVCWCVGIALDAESIAKQNKAKNEARKRAMRAAGVQAGDEASDGKWAVSAMQQVKTIPMMVTYALHI